MRRKNLGTWQDYLAWSLLLLGLLLMLLPRNATRPFLVQAQTALLSPLRLVADRQADLRQIRAENQRLSRLAVELAVRNARLETLAGSTAPWLDSAVAVVRAPIIARDLSTLERYLVVSRGRSQGIVPGTPVLAPQGLVGLVVEAGEHQSLVQTILDPEFQVSVINARSRLAALARAVGSGYLSAEFALPEADFEVGDTVLTAGLGGVFPKNLLVGFVTDVAIPPSALFKTIRLKAAAELARLEAVYLLPIRRRPRGEDEWYEGLAPLEVSPPEGLH